MSCAPPAHRNVEIKARAAAWTVQHERAAALADRVEQLVQVDTFFAVPRGLLKLRVFGDGTGELIQYHRPRASAAKTSNYRIVTVADPAGTRALLAAALGERVTVCKRRTVYHCGATRVHFDEVEGLGRFLELEVVLRPDQDEGEGRAIADGLMQALGIAPADRVAGAYAELLACENPDENQATGSAQALPQGDSRRHASDA